MIRKIVTLTLSMAAVIFMSFMTEPPRYKNLKVLPKNTDKHQLDSVMKHFTASLGVQCNFCHVRLNDEQKNWDFASDANNHKKIAREMMEMTAKINKKYFDVNVKSWDAPLEVTCYTCHNGKAHPGTIPPPPPPRPQRREGGDSTRAVQQ